MTVKLGISLSDDTHRAVVAAAAAAGLPRSTFVDRTLARELYRQGVVDHNAMLRDAGLADREHNARRVEARQHALTRWKSAQSEDGVG